MFNAENDTIRTRIATLDLEPIKFKLVVAGDFTEEKVQKLDKWYRRFLFLSISNPNQPIVVTEALDRFWHAHILDTRKYADDCRFVFGGFLHHFPYFGLRGNEDKQALHAAYRATLELMHREYGETPADDQDLEVLGERGEAPSLCSDCSGIAACTGHEDSATETRQQSPSLCSDCSGSSTKAPFSEQRPRLHA